MNIIKRIRRIWRKLRNSDPVYNCPVYKNEGCAYVDGPFCVPDCKIVYNYLDRKWVCCLMCKFNDELNKVENIIDYEHYKRIVSRKSYKSK